MSQAGVIDIEQSHPQIPTAFVTNVGTAIPIGNVLEILATVVASHGVPIQTTGSGNTVTIQAQYASAAASSVGTNAGFASFNSTQFSVDANGFVSLSGSTAAFTSMNVQFFASSGLYTPTAGMLYAVVELMGGGGGGGGVGPTVAGVSCAAGGGGGAGQYQRKTLSAASIGASQVVGIGGAGSGGTSAGGNGSTGGTSFFGAIFTAIGGSGGAGMTATTTMSAASGSPVNVSFGGGDFLTSAQGGAAGFAIQNATSSLIVSGQGGSSLWGGGAQSTLITSTGISGNNWGGGGSGAGGVGGAGSVGGQGAQGACVITEFI
jgi:hypothetical protein